MTVRPAAALSAALALLAFPGASPALAQADTLLSLWSGSPASERFRVDSAGGVVVLGTLNQGVIPAEGNGVRMMWYPRKAAFRAGRVDGGQWEDAIVGSHSVAMGWNATASGANSTATGSATTASGSSSIAMGFSTTASGINSTAIGAVSLASGGYSTAMGVRAHARHAGSFVWGSTSPLAGFPPDSISSTAVGQFSIRAVGGIRLFTNQSMTSGVTMAGGAGSWTMVSDRARKEDFAEVDGEDLLHRLRGVPVTRWRYIAEEDRDVSHIGPMAQDWAAAFPELGGDGLTINQGDLDGVNLAGVRALEERTRNVPEVERELARLREENAALRAEAAEQRGETADLRVRLERLETLLAAPAADR